jgi:hypothetical protein
MAHEFTSQSGRVFTAEKRGEKYIINGCAVAEKNFCWFGVNGLEAEKLCANIGAPKNTSVKIVLDRAEFSRLMAAFSAEQEEFLSSLPTQYRVEDVFVNADGDMVPIGKKITEYKVDESGNEYVIIVREFKNLVMKLYGTPYQRYYGNMYNGPDLTSQRIQFPTLGVEFGFDHINYNPASWVDNDQFADDYPDLSGEFLALYRRERYIIRFQNGRPTHWRTNHVVTSWHAR